MKSTVWIIYCRRIPPLSKSRLTLTSRDNQLPKKASRDVERSPLLIIRNRSDGYIGILRWVAKLNRDIGLTPYSLSDPNVTDGLFYAANKKQTILQPFAPRNSNPFAQCSLNATASFFRFELRFSYFFTLFHTLFSEFACILNIYML